MSEFAPYLQKVAAGETLTADEAESAIGCLMDGEVPATQIAAFLAAIAARGEADSELLGGAKAMRARSLKIPIDRSGLLDTCGTGGDGLRTFNISTATALVVAACGVPVAKHGNRSASSSSGSADVLEAMGVNVSLSPDRVADCLNQIGIGFCYARLFHSAMKHVAPVRSELGIRTLFNLLGPLTNPADAEYQLLGISSPAHQLPVAKALSSLGIKRAAVVCGTDRLDEVSLWGETRAVIVDAGEIREEIWTAATFGVSECTPTELRVDSPAESASVIQAILAGESGPARDIVVANAAAALWVVGMCDDLSDGAGRASAAIDDREAAELTRRLAGFGH